MSPTRDEQRQAVLGNLATHGQVQWHTRGADIAFADDVLELAARMRRQADDAVPPRPLRVATEEERSRHITKIHADLAAIKPPMRATGGRRSDAEGQGGTRTPQSRQKGTQGDE